VSAKGFAALSNKGRTVSKSNSGAGDHDRYFNASCCPVREKGPLVECSDSLSQSIDAGKGGDFQALTLGPAWGPVLFLNWKRSWDQLSETGKGSPVGKRGG